ncbi:MAG: nuclear transport factor 2 family protein [Acidimicrobiales bacterium]
MEGRSDPLATASRYLALCEERQLDEASRYLAPGAELVFPGDRHFTSLEAMATSSAGRYRSVRKRPTTEVVGQRVSDGRTVVVSAGTLEGESLDGSPFSGVRYADLFVFEGGLIVEQHVYNDLAEAGIVPATGR